MADGRKQKAVLMPNCPLFIREYWTCLDFYALPIAHDVILGKAWLEAVNPSIDWKNNIITFVDQKNRRHVWEAVEDMTGDIDDDLIISATQLKRLARKRDGLWICALTDIEEFHKALDDDSMKKQPAYLRKVLEEHTEVFSGVHRMPPSRPQDHRIELVPGAQPPWSHTYHMSGKELELLKADLT